MMRGGIRSLQQRLRSPRIMEQPPRSITLATVELRADEIGLLADYGRCSDRRKQAVRDFARKLGLLDNPLPANVVPFPAQR